MTQISNLKSAENVFFKMAMLKKKKISKITRLDFYLIFFIHNRSSLHFSMYSHWGPFLCDKTFKNRKEINSKLSEFSVTRIPNYFNKKPDYFLIVLWIVVLAVMSSIPQSGSENNILGWPESPDT